MFCQPKIEPTQSMLSLFATSFESKLERPPTLKVGSDLCTNPDVRYWSWLVCKKGGSNTFPHIGGKELEIGRKKKGVLVDIRY